MNKQGRKCVEGLIELIMILYINKKIDALAFRKKKWQLIQSRSVSGKERPQRFVIPLAELVNNDKNYLFIALIFRKFGNYKQDVSLIDVDFCVKTK